MILINPHPFEQGPRSPPLRPLEQPFPIAGSGERAYRGRVIDTGAVYERTKRAFVVTVTEADVDHLVPATPAWTVRDVLAHVIGLAADLNAQRFPDPEDEGGAAWSAQQVASRQGRTLAELTAEWDRESPRFADGLRLFGYEFGSHFAADLHAHHQDVRQALGGTRDNDPLTVAVALDHYVGFLGAQLATMDWGSVTATTECGTRQVGINGSHHASIETSAFELLRAVSGRRSLDQIRALPWQGDVDALLAVLPSVYVGGYSLPIVDLDE